MICLEYNNYIKTLVKQLEMLWIVTLNNGSKVFSDYDNEYYSGTPWERLKQYCKDTGLFPVKIESLMFGAPKVTMAYNAMGLDGVFIKRGISKDLLMDSGEEGTTYKQLIVGVLNDDNDQISITKFCWPENELEPFNETRNLTQENFELMFFKDDSRKLKRQSIQVYLNGSTV